MRRDEQHDDTWMLTQSLLALAERWGAVLSCRLCGAVLVARTDGEAVVERRVHVCVGRPGQARPSGSGRRPS